MLDLETLLHPADFSKHSGILVAAVASTALIALLERQRKGSVSRTTDHHEPELPFSHRAAEDRITNLP